MEPNDEFCVCCGSKIESYYSESNPEYDHADYEINDATQQGPTNKNNIAVYIILAVVGALLIECIAWILYNQFHKNGRTATVCLYRCANRTSRETVYMTIAPCPVPVSESGEYLLPDSANRLITDADLSRLTHEALCFARNEIHTRHGRQFDTPQVAGFFEGKSWYSGTERKNVDIIFDYEKSHFGESYY